MIDEYQTHQNAATKGIRFPQIRTLSCVLPHLCSHDLLTSHLSSPGGLCIPTLNSVHMVLHSITTVDTLHISHMARLTASCEVVQSFVFFCTPVVGHHCSQTFGMRSMPANQRDVGKTSGGINIAHVGSHLICHSIFPLKGQCRKMRRNMKLSSRHQQGNELKWFYPFHWPINHQHVR